MRILVVDDQSSIRTLIKGLLRNVGVTDVVEASNGALALQRLRNSPPFDLMICDWNMPEINGVELVRTVRSDPALFALRVLMLTSEHSRDSVLKAAALKIQGYVVKPFKPDLLIRSVKEALNQPVPVLLSNPPSEGASG